VDRQTLATCRLNQRITKKRIVGIRGKDRLPVVAPLHEMLRLSGDDLAGKADHGGSCRGPNAERIPYISCLTPFLFLFFCYGIRLYHSARAKHRGRHVMRSSLKSSILWIAALLPTPAA